MDFESLQDSESSPLHTNTTRTLFAAHSRDRCNLRDPLLVTHPRAAADVTNLPSRDNTMSCLFRSSSNGYFHLRSNGSVQSRSQVRLESNSDASSISGRFPVTPNRDKARRPRGMSRHESGLARRRELSQAAATTASAVPSPPRLLYLGRFSARMLLDLVSSVNSCRCPTIDRSATTAARARTPR